MVLSRSVTVRFPLFLFSELYAFSTRWHYSGAREWPYRSVRGLVLLPTFVFPALSNRAPLQWNYLKFLFISISTLLIFQFLNIFKSTQFDEWVSECLCLPPFFVPICYSGELSVVGCLYSLCYKCCELIWSLYLLNYLLDLVISNAEAHLKCNAPFKNFWVSLNWCDLSQEDRLDIRKNIDRKDNDTM